MTYEGIADTNCILGDIIGVLDEVLRKSYTVLVTIIGPSLNIR